MLCTKSPLKMPKMQPKPLRNLICACVTLIMMTFLWHRMREPMVKTGGLIASPPQYEDHPDGPAIVKFKNIKKTPQNMFSMNDVLLATSHQHGKDPSLHSEALNIPSTNIGLPRPGHLISKPEQPRKQSQPPPNEKPPSTPMKANSSPKGKIAKVSMLTSSLFDYVYENAMQIQKDHALHHKNPIHVMSNEIIPSCRGLPAKCNPHDAHTLAGHWNKVLYLHSILIAEFAKPATERVDWLMWQDSDSITVNPSIPLDIFLPPSDMKEAVNVHMLATKDDAGLNSGVFFLRVSPWSVRFLTTCLAVSVTASPYEDLGWSYDQTAMARLLEEDEEFKRGVVWQPRKWYNAYGTEEIYGLGENMEYDPDAGKDRGRVLNMHFPGMSDDHRIPLMEEWLQRLEDEGGWDVPPMESGLLEEIEDFWSDLTQMDAKELRRAKLS